MFKNWIIKANLGYKVVSEAEFLSNKENGILDASEDKLKQLAKVKFDYNRNKRIDFFARVKGRYIIGEAKFFLLILAAIKILNLKMH